MNVATYNELDSKQSSALAELRSRMEGMISPEKIQDERYLTRWLIARDFDVEKAYSMLCKSLEWRAQIGADTILETFTVPEVLRKYYAGGVCGFDREGFPIWIDPMPTIDFKGILSSVTRTDILKFKVHMVELLQSMLKQQSDKHGRRIDQMNIIFDLEGLGWRHLWKPAVDAFVQVVKMFEDNYPEMLKRTYIIHAPKVFVVAYGMLRPVLSERTTSKVLVLGKNWRDVLLRDIEADQLPVAYGGTMVDENGDPRCSSKVNYGGEVPESYFTKNKASCSGDDECNSSDMLVASVDRGSSFQLYHHIVISGCSLRCFFKTESHDIGIGVYYCSEPPAQNEETMKQLQQRRRTQQWDVKKMEALVPCERISCSQATHQVDVLCERVGMYVIHLDNTYSWTRGKRVHYSVEVIRPVREASGVSLLEEMSAADL